LLFIEINGDHVAFPTLDEIEQLGIDIDFILNCGDAVDSKWAPSADADPEDDEAQYQLVVCSPEDPLPFTSPAFIPLRDVADPLQDGPANKMSDEEASGGALIDAVQNVFPNGPGPSATLTKLDTMLANKIRVWTASVRRPMQKKQSTAGASVRT